jgi:hypothetical protein
MMGAGRGAIALNEWRKIGGELRGRFGFAPLIRTPIQSLLCDIDFLAGAYSVGGRGAC